MKQIARNLTEPVDGSLKDRCHFIHDRDWLYTEACREMLRSSGAGPPGPLVREVESGSPAEVAGIRAGDRILTVGGAPTPDRRTLREVLGRYAVGKQAEVRVRRGDREFQLTVWFSGRVR